jgi:meso-butanediol dehydrogenase/(S,S)-butanediol dehydrogenase/diacetyl reductase
MRLKDKVVVITGAARGIGRACASAFAEQGARIVVADKDADEARDVAQAIEQGGHVASSQPVDISSESDVREMIAHAVERFGRIDTLVANAGIGGRRLGDGPVADCTLDAWNTIMRVNLTGTFLSCKHAIPELIKTKGSIVAMSSVLGLVGTPGLFDTHAYATSKAGIIGLIRQIAVHYARDGIRANVIAPGLMDTDMARRTKSDPELGSRVAALQLLAPLGQVDDVAAAAIYLASEESKFVTGTVLNVDGGWSAQ